MKQVLWLVCLALGACGGRTLAPEGEDPPGELGGVTSQHSPSSEATTAADPVAAATVAPEPSVPASQPSNPSNSQGTDEAASAPSAADSGSIECPSSYPETHWSPPQWIPYGVEGSPTGTEGASLLSGVQAAIVGHWHGLAKTPWTTPYEVDVTFDADGHYSAHCSDPAIAECCRAFYYGTDDDTPLKQWRIDATVSGKVFGQIDIAFDYPNGTSVDYGLPAWQGELSAIERDAFGEGLRFKFATSTGYGPVRYDLRRQSR
jgi:hypothetical protein